MNAPAQHRYKPRFDQYCFRSLAEVDGDDGEVAGDEFRRPAAGLGERGEGAKPPELSDDQAEAYDVILKWLAGGNSNLLSLGGYAGTGKSTLISLLAMQHPHLRIAFVALTGKAAGVMRSKMRELGVCSPTHQIGTLHSLLYQSYVHKCTANCMGPEKKPCPLSGTLCWSAKPETLEAFDLIVVDEGSMVSDQILGDLRRAGPRKILLVGDHGQLPPIGGASELMMNPDLRLEKIHRQAEGNPILELSRIIREEGDMPARPPTGSTGSVQYVAKKDLKSLCARLLEEKVPLEDLGLLAATNAMRVSANKMVRGLRWGDERGEGKGAASRPRPGDQVICLKNAYKLAFNGMRGTIRTLVEVSSPHYYEGAIDFPDDNLSFGGSFSSLFFNREKSPSSLDAFRADGLYIHDWNDLGFCVDYGYCMTTHKAQGSQFGTVVVIRQKLPSLGWDGFRRWLYTSVTRCKSNLYIVV